MSGTLIAVCAVGRTRYDVRADGPTAIDKRPLAGAAGERATAAASAATATVELAAPVRSSRSTEAVNDLRARLRDHDQAPAVAEFFELADTILPTST